MFYVNKSLNLIMNQLCIFELNYLIKHWIKLLDSYGLLLQCILMKFQKHSFG